LNQVLLEQALKRREALKSAYLELGIKINPLLLIQLPNDNKTESVEDIKIKEEVETFLEVKGITTQNHKLAIWLSKQYINKEGIEDFDSITEVLLFKQAISLGWDCPRAAVLLIFREIQQETFTIQTVGRILRMPEHKHYTNGLLNNGYVFTNLSKRMIQVVADDMDYIVHNKAIRIQHYQALELSSYYINTRINRNRLSSKFRKCLFEAAEEYFAVTTDISKTEGESIYHFNLKMLKQRLIETDISTIEIPIPRDVALTGEVGITEVDKMERFAKTQSELDIIFRQFCRNNVGGYAKVESTPVLELALKVFFEEYLSIDEFVAVKIMLHEENKPKFVELIDRALEKHEILLQQKAAQGSKRTEESMWDVPPEKIYNEYYEEIGVNQSALEPFYQYKLASKPEQGFVEFLERNQTFIDWWYKNGEKNKEDFAITYIDKQGITRGFYVDFVVKLKSGKVALFDTKTEDSDKEFVAKHNALIEYIEKKSTSEKELIGGVIVPKRTGDITLWKYCTNRISNAKDITG